MILNNRKDSWISAYPRAYIYLRTLLYTLAGIAAGIILSYLLSFSAIDGRTLTIDLATLSGIIFGYVSGLMKLLKLDHATSH